MTTLLEQTGQMLVSGFHGTTLNSETENLILNRGVGGLILFERNFENPTQLIELIQSLQELAATTHFKRPLFISVDQEGGRVSRLREPFTQFPDPCCLGVAQSESLAYRFGLALGSEMRAVGINMDYAPGLDINTNPDNPIIGKRAFSNQPEWAAKLGVQFIRGFKEAGILAVGKHFPGHGDTSLDSHLALPFVDRSVDTLEREELPPFTQAIEEGLEVLMTAHVIYGQWDEKNPATFSPFILQNLLRQKLGFQGLIISDDLEMKAVQDHYAFESYPTLGTQAGIDLFLICHDVDKVKKLQDIMIRDIEGGRIPVERINNSVQNILRVKDGIPTATADSGRFSTLVETHRSLVEEMQSHLVS